MSDKENVTWKKIFGEAWHNIIEFCPDIGGFLIDNKTRSVFLDSSAQKLSGMDGSPDYDKMLEFLNQLHRHYENGTQLSAQIVSYSDSELTAGVIKRSEDVREWKRKTMLPVCENSRLVLELSQNTAPSLLALVELCSKDSSEPSKYQIFDAVTAIIKFSPKGTLLSIHSANRFWLYVPDFRGNSVEYMEKLTKTVHEAASEEMRLDFSIGIGEDNVPIAKRMSTAEFALYEATMKGPGSIVAYSVEQYENNRQEFEKMNRFLRLVGENLFVYHFQPIVSAFNGEIVAYEMLMRSESDIGLGPIDILDCAEKAHRLYDIEKATMKNSLDVIGNHQDLLKDRKLFVNSITAHMLTDEDWNVLEEQYGELMEKMVIEFTEQTEIDDEKLAAIHERHSRHNIKLAVDDFGTGYSNTSNLIRYKPDYVKIDRALITDIHKKQKIRKLVSGIIEFIHANGYQALAEGVETYEELQTVIQLGCDLIQGYYTSKPKPVMLLEISQNVIHDIENINVENSSNISRAYHPAEGETVDLCMIRADGYNSVFIETPNVTLKGKPDVLLDTLFIVKDGLKAKIVFDSVRSKTDKEPPALMLGDNCEIEIEAVGKNELDGRGIYVPQTSTITLTGNGEMRVISNRSDCYAIGAGSGEIPGNIIIAMHGTLYAEANGDNAVAVGGGKNDCSNVIRFISGDITLACSGRRCVAAGIMYGGSIVDIENCKFTVTINAPDSVGVGSLSGATDIQAKNYLMNIRLSGINAACIGTLENGAGRIMLSSGNISCTANGRTINCIGTRKGNTDCVIMNSNVKFYCEGGSVSGIGDMTGVGETTIRNVEMDFRFLAGESLAYGSRGGLVHTEHCLEHIKIND